MEEEIQKAKRKYIRMFYEAQVTTQELQRGTDNIDKQGHVYLYSQDTPEAQRNKYNTLTYIKYDQDKKEDGSYDEKDTANNFKKMIANNEIGIQNYFSINDKGELVLASVQTTITETVTQRDDGSNDEFESNTNRTITEVPIDYKNMISQYSTPMSFFLELGMVTRNPNFLAAVVEDVVKKNTDIKLTVLNTTTEEFNKKIESSTEHVRSRIKTDVGNGEQAVIPYDTDITTTVTTTTKIKTVAPTVKVASVDTWVCSQKFTYNLMPGEPIKEPTEDDYEHIKQESEKEKKLSDDETKVEKVSWTTREDTKIYSATKVDTYDAGIASDYEYRAGEKPDEDSTYTSFVDLLDVPYSIPNSTEKRTAGSYLESDAEIFFSLLQQSPETQGMEQVMRYIMYKYDPKKFPEVELDFSMFDVNYFSSITSGGTLSNYIKAWENLDLWKYESGYVTTKPSKYITSEDGKDYYIVYEDGSAGHNNIAYGVATFISDKSNATSHHELYGDGYYNWSTKFASNGIDVTTLKTGDLVDKETALAVFSSILKEDFENPIDNYLRENGITLEKSQRDALVAVKYQYGNIGNFAEAYKKCGNTEALKTEFKTAKGAQPFNGSSDRKVANWNLFNTGVYLAKDGTEIKSGIIDIADSIHKYMEDNNYKYCVFFSNKYEEHTRSNECGLDTTFEKSKVHKQNSCCATYVSWVLQEAGYLTEAEHTDGANSLRTILMRKGWQMVNNVSDLQPGDIICYNGHIEIYAGDGKVYNAGSGNAIRRSSPYNKNVSEMLFGLRAPD